MKLAVKYAVTILSLVFCIVLAFACVILIQFRSEIARLNASSADTLRQSVLKQMQEKEATSVRVLVSTLTNPLYQLDMLKINELVSAVGKQPDVLYIYVYDNKRRIIHDGTQELKSYDKVLDDPLTTESMRSVRLLNRVDGDTFHISAPIQIQNEVIGGVKVGYSFKNIFLDLAKQKEDLAKNYHVVATRQLYTIGILALAFSIGGLIVAVLVARSWSSPITLLSNLTARVGEGDYEVLIPVNRGDEIGRLASSFNDMVSNLKRLRDKDIAQSEALMSANRELQRSNNELTNQISERQRVQKNLLDQNRRMQVLHEISAAISLTLDPMVLVEALFDKIESLLPYSAITVRLINKDTNRFEPTLARNLNFEGRDQEGEAHSEVTRNGLSKAVLATKAPLIVENVQTDPRAATPDLYRRFGLVSYAGVPLIAEGEILGVFGFYTKTEHRFTAEETEFLLTLAGEVATSIRKSQLYEQLKMQAKRLEEANRAKDEFLSVMSHELRTPLNVIMGYAQVLSSGMMGDVSPDQEKSLKKLMLHADDLLNMINDILQAGRIQSGLINVELESVNIGELLVGLESAYEVRSKKDVALNWHYLSTLPLIETDRSKLKHVIQNLVNNGIKFTDEGSVTVTARSIPAGVEFKVQDTGIGIPRESFASIFEMFRQADSSRTRTHGGTGVGLYIVKKFTEALNGQVHVESVVGEGTTFTLTLPLDASHNQRRTANLASSADLTTGGGSYNATPRSAYSTGR